MAFEVLGEEFPFTDAFEEARQALANAITSSDVGVDARLFIERAIYLPTSPVRIREWDEHGDGDEMEGWVWCARMRNLLLVPSLMRSPQYQSFSIALRTGNVISAFKALLDYLNGVRSWPAQDYLTGPEAPSAFNR